MPDSKTKSTVDRRELLLGAIFLVGGAAALTRFTGSSRAAGEAGVPALTAEQFALLEQICETIIPTTDTPGAIAAGVPAFMRELLQQWSSAESRAQVRNVLDAIERASWSKFGAAFLELTPERRDDIVSAYDAEQVASGDAGYGRFKWLVLVGYYQSEAGATQELRFELVPGAWRACVPLNEIGRASAV